MILHSISFYEEQLKQQIMDNFTGANAMSLQNYTEKLILENQNNYKNIAYAYLNIKNELIGSYDDK